MLPTIAHRSVIVKILLGHYTSGDSDRGLMTDIVLLPEFIFGIITLAKQIIFRPPFSRDRLPPRLIRW